MPEQKSTSTLPVTGAAFEQPFETHILRYGVKGINLIDALDALEPNELSRMLNLDNQAAAGVHPRDGQTYLAEANDPFYGVGRNVHSIRRLNDPTGGYLRVYGVDNTLMTGTTGALTPRDWGYSGLPMSLCPFRDDFSGETWMYVGDSAQTQKVAADGTTLDWGLVAPVTAATAAINSTERTTIIPDNATYYQQWSSYRGYEYGASGGLFFAGGATPNIFMTFHPITDQNGKAGVAAVVPAPIYRTQWGYFAFGGVACNPALNLAQVGTIASDLQDYIHASLRVVNIKGVQEIRLYFVCSQAFDPRVVPGFVIDPINFLGSSVPAPNSNTDAYLKSFSANDFAAYVAAQQLQINAAEQARVRALRNDSLNENAITDTRAGLQTRMASINPEATLTEQTALGEGAWSEYGILGVPLRRADFQRIGSNFSRDWSTITGIVFAVVTGPDSGGVEVDISDVYLHGGYAPDTGEAGFSAYDYRYTNYDRRTGAEGNPSPEMAAGIDTLRQKILVTPQVFSGYGRNDVHQRFYRRGGSLPTDWYFLGENTVDGGTFTDIYSDEEAVASSTLEIDNDRPVSTVDGSGTTVYAQAVSSVWGPLDDMLFACGDPFRPGDVYFCKPGRPDSWPPDNHTGVTAPSERLQAGCMYGGQSFVFSTERCFVLYPNLQDGTNVTAANTQCKRGMLNRWALTVGVGGMYFVDHDGVYRTVGGPEEWISRKIDPLFRGEMKNGFYPIDMNVLEAIRLEIYQQELWFSYQDTQGTRMVMIYNIPFGFWRPYMFTIPTSVVYRDEGGTDQLIMGGSQDGKVYTYEGDTDDGTDITWQARTGCLTFDRRVRRSGWAIRYSMQTQTLRQSFCRTSTTMRPTAQHRYLPPPEQDGLGLSGMTSARLRIGRTTSL
jgi:hypothetical protein